MFEDASRTQRLYLLSPDALCGSCWRPAVDVYRDQEGWLVKFDLAGVGPNEIELSARGRILTVAGIRRDITVAEGIRAYSMEISYSRFERSVELPVNLDRFSINSESRDGMFLVSVRPQARQT